MSDKQKTLVVSGCTKGIGRAIAELFALEGFNIAGCARHENDLEEMQNSFVSRYPDQQFAFIPCDMSIKQQVLGFAEKIKKQFSKVDVLVNNAGVFLPGKLIDEKEGTLENLIETNLYSAYHLTRALVGGMQKNKEGSIFNICSIAGIQAYPGGGSYAVSKAAMLGLSRQLREELQPYLIRVTAVIPGAVLTDSWAGSGLSASRFIQPGDIAKTILAVYQLSDHTDVEEILIRPQAGDI